MKALSWSWWVGDTAGRRAAVEAEYERRMEAESARGAAQAEAAVAWQERRAKEAVFFSSLRCPKCSGPISATWENDYMCDVHSFVNPVTPNGDIIAGDGVCGVPRVIGHVSKRNPISWAYHQWLVQS